jgi:hypothetical protein
VPVGTEYDWYIVAHQVARKLNANDYATSMTGLKFKVAHKRADSEKWNSSEKTRRKRLIQFLEARIEELKKDPEAEGEGKDPVVAESKAKTAARRVAPKTTPRRPSKIARQPSRKAAGKKPIRVEEF